MRPTKFTWDPHDLVGHMWILTDQKGCVEKCVEKCVASIPLLIIKLLEKKEVVFVWFLNSTFCFLEIKIYFWKLWKKKFYKWLCCRNWNLA